IIVNRENEIVFPEQIDVDMKTLAEIKNNNDRYQIIRQNENAYFLTYRESELTDWTYYTLTPYDHIFNTTDKAKKNVLIVYLALFSLASIIAFQLAKRITDPLEKLTLKMRRVQLGNFH